MKPLYNGPRFSKNFSCFGYLGNFSVAGDPDIPVWKRTWSNDFPKKNGNTERKDYLASITRCSDAAHPNIVIYNFILGPFILSLGKI